VPTVLAVMVLTFLVCAVFWPILGFQFVDYDVNDQLVNNSHVHGISLENIKYILTSNCINSYYPVRAFTLALDYQVWGLEPSGFKLTNGLIHLANALLVFWLILRLFGQRDADCGASGEWWDVFAAAFLAAVFAVHPVVVEPVAWIAGREELLMTLGAMGCMHFHLSATRVSQLGANTRRALHYHVAATLCCAAACLSNAVGAVVPALITAWDVLTMARPRLSKIVRGTAALWALGIATIVIKKLGPGGDATPLAPIFSAEWLMLALRTYWMNLTTLVWPTRLAILYEWIRPESFLEKEVVLGGVVIGLTCLLMWKSRGKALIIFGLLWFVLTLAPTSQVIPHHIPRADRFLYLPFVGLAVAAAMAVRPLSRAVTGRFAVAGPLVAAGAILGVLTMLTARQVQTWRNTTTMWEHCVRAAPFNPMAHGLLADVLQEEGRLDEAARHYVISAQQELIMYPERASAHSNWGEHLLHQDRLEEAKAYFVRAIEMQPDLAKAHCNLGIVLSRQDKTQEAEKAYREALRHDPDVALAHLHLGTLLAELGALEAAKKHLSEAVRLDPHDAYTQFNLGIAFCKEQEFGQAAIYLNRALKEDPAFVPALMSLALLRATSNDAAHRNGLEAVELAERACQLTGYEHPEAVHTLAAAYAEVGRIPDAVSAAKHGIRVALASGNGALANTIRQSLELYRQDMPLRSYHSSD